MKALTRLVASWLLPAVGMMTKRAAIRISGTGQDAETPRLALYAAFPVLERRLVRYRERDRDRKRYPKKYFAPRRTVAR